jgi:hypothetical protein
VVTIRRILRLLAITLPPLIGIIVYWLCKRAQRRSLAAHAVAGLETAESPGNSEALPSEGRAAKM